jgi:hypothetical protein
MDKSDKSEKIYIETQSGVCLTRRNIFDIFIAILLAVIIIYIVVQWRKASQISIESIVPASIASAFTAPSAPPVVPPVAPSAITQPRPPVEVGEEMLGGAKGLFKGMSKKLQKMFKI